MFTAVAGQQIRLEGVKASAPGIVFDLEGPGGWSGFTGLTNQSDLLTLPGSGVYTLTARILGGGYNAVYTFRIQETAQTSLTIGTLFTGSFVGSDQAQLFRVDVPANRPLRIRLINPGGESNRVDIYARFGVPPTRGAFDFLSQRASAQTQSFAIPSPYAGSYYVLIYGDTITTPGAYTVQIDSADLLLTEAIPSSVGNSLAGSVTIHGAGFTTSDTVDLVDGASVYPATHVSFISESALVAEFNFPAIPTNMYSLRVAAGTKADALPFSIKRGIGAKLEANLIGPSQLGRNTVANLYLEYANIGDAAMPAPLLVLTGSQNALLTMKLDSVVSDFYRCAQPRDAKSTVQILGSGSTPGVLQPGERVRVPIHYLGLENGGDIRNAVVEFDIGYAAPPGYQGTPTPPPIDWGSLKPQMRPPSIPADAWEAVWQNFTTAAGNTWSSYQSMLRKNAEYLSRLGFGNFFSPVPRVSGWTPQIAPQHVGDMLAFEFAQADGLHVLRFLASATDGFARTPGLRLSFERVFPNRITERYQLGALGRGWSHNWETRLEQSSSCEVTIIGSAGSRRTFRADRRGGWFNDPGDHATLTALGGGRYSLGEKDGLLRVFKADGKLEYVEDPNNTRITCGYSGDDLVSLAHSSGQTLQLTYSGGRIASITDPLGRQTVFAYDGEHLASAHYYDGSEAHYSYSLGHPLLITDIQGLKPNGNPVANAFGSPGRVVVLGQEPLLEALPSGHGQLRLILYAEPGTTNMLQTAMGLPPRGSWAPWQEVVATNLIHPLSPFPAKDQTMFI